MVINVSKVGTDGWSVKVDKGDTIVVRKAEDLEPLKTEVLVAMYNKANPKTAIKKFSDRAAAKNRVFLYLPQLSGMMLEKPKAGSVGAALESMPEKAPKKTFDAKTLVEKPKAPKPVPAGAHTRKSGVIYTCKQFCIAKPRTMEEIVAHLSTAFPDRKPESMQTTILINASPRFNNALGEWVKTKADGKPTTYHYIPKGA